MIKEMNDPTVKIVDTVRLAIPPRFNPYDVVYGSATTPEYYMQLIDNERIIDGECTVIEIDDKKLIGDK